MRVLLYLWILLWGFDRALFWATEAAWFGSVGQGAWFGTRFWAQFALFWASLGLALVSAALAMRVAARPAPGLEARGLPVALERLEPLRRGALRLAWAGLIVGAWVVARHVAGGWPTVLAARAGGASDPIYWLPLARLLLGNLWSWLLILLGATAFAGGLRALPALATRLPAPPVRLWRALGVVGALALLLRGALYLLAMLEANLSDGTTGAEFYLGQPLAIAGAALCGWAALWCLRRPGLRRVGAAVALALLAPRLAGLLLAPLGLVLSAPAGIEARVQSATRAGWNLDGAPAIAAAAPPLAAHWPIWNQEALLGLARGGFARNPQHVIDWRRATVEPRAAIVAGVPAGLENWGAPHEADAFNALEWLAFDPTRSADGRAPALPDAPLPLPSFYGVSGRPLLGDAAQSAGVPFRFWGWKFAWAWRLRDPLLMLEGARADRLLVFRGARECAERLAPFLLWDEAQLRATARGPRWQLTGYAVTPYFRGALATNEGAFAGQNAGQNAVLLQLDPRDGRAEFIRAPLATSPAAAWSAPWRALLRAQTNAEAGLPLAQTPLAQTPLLEAARAGVARRVAPRLALPEPVWTWAEGSARARLLASNWPDGVAARLAALDGAAQRGWDRGESQTLQPGDALLWPDARAPGGFWVGRPYYALETAPGVASTGGIAHSARVWRVSLTGLAPSPIAAGDDTRAALVAFDLTRAPQSALDLPPASGAATESLALQALRAHDAAQKAASASQWDEWDKQAARERKLLEQLATRSAR